MIEYDPHALKRMTSRAITKSQVERVLLGTVPGKTRPGALGRWLTEALFGPRLLRVVWSRKPRYVRYVWTVMWVGEPDGE